MGSHPGGNPGANLESISHRRYLFEVAFVWELTKETIVLPLVASRAGFDFARARCAGARRATSGATASSARFFVPAEPVEAEIKCVLHPGGNPGANLKSISHRCHLILVAFVWELTIETIYLPMVCIQSGLAAQSSGVKWLPATCARGACLRACTTLEATHGQILSQSPTDATRFWWHLYGR